jgi:thiamine biosynthesis lipoprotein
MGTKVDAWTDGDGAALERWFEEAEMACSRFVPTSELSFINRAAPGRVALSPLMEDVLAAAAHIREATGGLVDIGLGRSVVEWGYDRTFEEVSSRAGPPGISEKPHWMLDGSSVVLSAGTIFDLGGVAKGWACDRAVESRMAVVVSAGGDMRSAHDETVASVVDPWGDVVARVALAEGALATSSVTRRRWRVGGQEVSHIIDPRTGNPVDSPVLSATAVAATAVEAEAAAKAVLLTGEDGLVWADETPWVRGALVVWWDRSVYASPGLAMSA